jgi:adenylate cyclase
VTDPDASEQLPDKLASEAKPACEVVPDKPASGRLRAQLRQRLQIATAALASIAAVGAIAGGLVGYWNAWKTLRTDVFQEKQKTQMAAAARPDIAPRLSLVILPFENLNNDPEQDYFADGITTDLTTDLAQMPGAFVIGRGTAFTYKGKQIDFKTLGKDLGVRWAIQGAVRRYGDQVRVNVSLTDLPTGRDIWSDRFDGDRKSLADLQDQITARLARSLNIELIQAESRRSETDRTTNPDAMDYNMRGWATFYAPPRTKMQIARAQELFESALRLDPDNVDAMIGKAWCLANGVINGWSRSVIEDKKMAAALLDAALSKRPGAALPHVVKGLVLFLGNPDEALSEFDAALEIDPNFPTAYAGRGQALTTAGRAREAFSPLQLALRLSPKDPFAFIWHYNICHAHLHLHEYKEAIEECRRSVNMNNSNLFSYVDLLSAYATTGQSEQAQQMLAEMNKLRPDFTVQMYRNIGYALSSNQQFRREFEDIVAGLTKAGVRER